MDEHCRLIQAGKELINHVPEELLSVGTPIMRIFEVNRPQIPFDFDNICNFINAVFVLQVKTSPTDMKRQIDEENGDGSTASATYHHGHHLKLKGQMMLLSDNKVGTTIIFHADEYRLFTEPFENHGLVLRYFMPFFVLAMSMSAVQSIYQATVCIHLDWQQFAGTEEEALKKALCCPFSNRR
ncbi:hypothetical protein NECAME_04581 [Necator americanus]|uniref:guanylate cyclase n=1 Tax=Necator americanus TaxID=51031 RepID=W2ST26_NECAM|nr:hypothetical protein NECAME_04581 [Necator americanus]ETN71837.1 hypothetical protein NECAME_04581 [Necator americanus]